MPGKSHALIIVGLLAATSYAPAVQTDFLVLADDWESDRVSGHPAAKFRLDAGEYTYSYDWPPLRPLVANASREIRQETTYAGLKGLTWRETAGRPCKIWVHSAALNAVYPTSSTQVKRQPEDKARSICNGIAGNEKRARFGDGTDLFVRGVAVCTSDKKKSGDERLTGIRIYAAEVKPGGTVAALDVDREDMDADCRQWHAPVHCPAGYIVSGLQVHHRDHYFTGLGIKCRRVIVASTPFRQ
ncbi:MAG: hypothetical protein PVF91_00255 [Chromatiales bacterium]|jgi:hypothetical protein